MAVIEVRIYKIHTGRRDEFVKLCDEVLIPAQREYGLDVLGQFASLDDDETYVWIRRFDNQEQRERQLEEFYGRPEWNELAVRAAPMVKDASHVLAVEPTPGSALQ
jgi:NIPSNAP protein